MRCNDLSANSERFYSSSGSRFVPQYQAKILKDGSLDLVKTGEVDGDEMIESHRLGTELCTLIARYENGDLSALNQVNGFYADVVNAPKNLPDAMQYVINAENCFAALPVDIKKQFDSDWKKWLAAVGTDEWMAAMSPDVKGEVKEVVEDEQKQ